MRVSSAFLIVSLVAAPVAAQSPNALVLADAVAEALRNNPEIAAAAHRHDAVLQKPAQERSLPDPMVSAGYNSSGRPWPGAGLGTEPTANIGVMATQELPFPGKRDLRAAIAVKEADADQQQVEAVRLSVVARVKQAYYRLAYTYAIDDVLVRNKSLLDTLLKVSEARYGVGRAAQQDVFKAQAELTIVALRQEQVAQERSAREAELNALLGRAARGPIARPDALELPPFDASADALAAAAEAHAPMLRRDQVMVDRAQLGVDAARKEYKPDFAVSGGYYNMGSMPSMYMFRFDVKVPLQRERRAAAVNEQLQATASAKAAYESTKLTLQARVQEEFAMATTSLRLARLYRDTVLPQVRLALESSMASYETGSIDFLSVLTNFGSVLEYEMTYFDELTAFHAAASRLEEMTGTSIEH